MNIALRKDVLALGALGLAAAALVTGLIVRSARPGTSAVNAVPEDTFLAASVDVWALAESPLGGALVGGDGGAGGGAASLLGMGDVQATCGFDPLAHLRSIAVAVPETKGDFGIAAAGDLGKDALASCARDLAQKHGGKPSSRAAGSFTVMTDDSAPGGASLAVREGGPFLVGRGPWLDHMIDVVEGRAPSLASSAEHASLRADLRARDADAEAVVVTAILPSSLRARIRGEMATEGTPDAGDRTRPENRAESSMDGVLGVASAALALHAGRTSARDDTRVVAELRCDTDAACAKVETLILHQRLEWSGDFRLRLAGLGPLIDSLETSRPTPAVLVVRAHMPAADLAHLLARYLSKAPPRPSHPR